MKHLLIAVVIGVLTIGISVFVLSDSDGSYESDAKEEKTISLNQAYEGENYTILPTSFDCGEFDAIRDGDEAEVGCVLSVEFSNTTFFEQILNLDGDVALNAAGDRFDSSNDISRTHVPGNGLVREVGVDETVSGGIFFIVPEDEVISSVYVYENTTSEPIVISL